MERIDTGAVRGFWHEAQGEPCGALVLTHGAGSDCQTVLLQKLAAELSRIGFHVLRCDLAFRIHNASGPPRPAHSKADREGLRAAVEFARGRYQGPTFLGGHSYGGRQASMLASEEPPVADALLLLSYPLHPPRKPEQLRTAHFPDLRTPALFVHGTRDPFGLPAEMVQHLAGIPGRHELFQIEGAGHDLGGGKRAPEIADAFRRFVNL